MMKLAKKTITAETIMGSHKAVSGIIPVFLLLAWSECQNSPSNEAELLLRSGHSNFPLSFLIIEPFVREN
jgi:hypothetical protein